MGHEVTEQHDFDSGITWQISDTPESFQHRLVYKDKSGNVVEEGEWRPYARIATIQVGDKLYACTLEYFSSVFPTETPFLVSPLSKI